MTKRLAWLTDLHLNFVGADEFARLVRHLAQAEPDAVLVGGDIGEAATFAAYLRELAAGLTVPVYFVLGNHDYYRGCIARVRRTARELSRSSERIKWLPDAGVVPIGAETALVGHGGWADGRCGDFHRSGVVLNDYVLIEELRDPVLVEGLRRGARAQDVLSPALLRKLNALGDEAAEHFRRVLPQALAQCRHVLVLTHVPPFHEACWHDGQPSDDNWAPHFTSKAVGEVLVEVMRQNPDRRMTVLCGHTHSPGRAVILETLEVLTGGAKYSQPEVQRVLEVD